MPKFGIKGETSNDLKEQIRQIVREEIAALLGRPVTLTVDGKDLAKTVASAADKTIRPLEL